jgi:hypothetical protein
LSAEGPARCLQRAVMLTAGRATIMAEFFDKGESLELPSARRPQAAALVAQLEDPDRGGRVDWHAEDHWVISTGTG